LAGGNINTARYQLGAFGISSAGVACGGRDSTNTVIASTETFNGTAWTAIGGGDLNVARTAFGTFGIQPAGVACGGINSTNNIIGSTEKFVP
jgi:hypothetical protein